MPKALSFTSRDRWIAHALGVALDDSPPEVAPHEARYEQLLKSYEHLEAECTEVHRALHRERNRACGQRMVLGTIALSSLLALAITLWANSRIGQ